MTTVLSDPSDAPAARSALPSASRLFRQTYLWSVRRELWEHRSVFAAPVAVALLFLFGYLLGALIHRHNVRFDDGQSGQLMAAPYAMATFAVLMTTLVVGLFYCLGALFNERRDRTILFWKSLPVSDLTAVLSKASIPILVLPVIAFAVVLVLQIAMLLIGSVSLLLAGQSLAGLWARVASPGDWVRLAYFLVVLSLWYAPIYGWLLLVSGWSRRAPFLWAVLPPLATGLVERLAFNSHFIFATLANRMGGFLRARTEDASSGDLSPLGLINPVALMATPGLWVGLLVFGALMAAAVWVRRRREPI